MDAFLHLIKWLQLHKDQMMLLGLEVMLVQLAAWEWGT